MDTRLISEKRPTVHLFHSDFSITVTPSEKEIEKNEETPDSVLHFTRSKSTNFHHLSPLSSFTITPVHRPSSPDELTQKKYIKDLRSFRKRAQSSMLQSTSKRIDLQSYSRSKDYTQNRKQRSKCNCEIF